MANFVSYLGETQVVVEAPAKSAFEKSESEVEADPRKALENCVLTVKKLALAFTKEIAPVSKQMGGDIEIRFCIRTDTGGMVMVSQDATEGQFQVAMKWSAPPPTPARPPAPRGGPPRGAPPRGGPPRGGSGGAPPRGGPPRGGGGPGGPGGRGGPPRGNR